MEVEETAEAEGGTGFDPTPRHAAQGTARSVIFAPGLTMATSGLRIRPGQPGLAAGAGGGSRPVTVDITVDVG